MLYARKLGCFRDRECQQQLENASALPLQPRVLVVAGPGAVVHMLDIGLRKRVGKPVPPPVDAAPGRGFACATLHCAFLVHRDPMYGGYCCMECCETARHGDACQRRHAPRHAPKADASWKPPGEKFAQPALGHGDLRKHDSELQPLSEGAKAEYVRVIGQRGVFPGPYCDPARLSASGCASLLTKRSEEHGWSLDLSPPFYKDLAYEGVFPMGAEFAIDGFPVQVLNLNTAEITLSNETAWLFRCSFR